MESLGLTELALVAGTSILGAGVIALLGWLAGKWGGQRQFGAGPNTAPAFLFDGNDLVDATEEAQRMIAQAASHLSDRETVIALLQDRFPTLSHVMTYIAPNATENLIAVDGVAICLRVEDVAGKTRLTLLGTDSDDQSALGERAAEDGLRQELQFLRSTVDAAPQLMWSQDINGKLTWANAAYMQLSDRQAMDSDATTKSWPQCAVFPDLHLDADASGPVTRRASVPVPDLAQEDWFDITTIKTDSGALHFAADANAAVTAEASKVKAMETAGRLFGNLATGLAIFDQRRRLAMFNPALTNLTGLKPSFMAMRPSLDSFLDALRESRMLPEPKNYTSWRDQFSELETEARAGTYCENWELIDGQTFRVTGKPYADNSFVFIFQDITAEVALTRRFRTDIETGQGVLDTLPNAIAVFSANGTLVMSNAAYRDLWDSDHEGSLHSHELRNEMIQWQRHCAAAPSWTDLREYISAADKASVWTDHMILDDGRHVECEAQRINRNSTMITFKIEEQAKIMTPIIHKLTMADPTLQGQKG